MVLSNDTNWFAGIYRTVEDIEAWVSGTGEVLLEDMPKYVY